MAPLIAALVSAGPSLIRMFGASKGGETEQVANTIADVVDTIKGKPTESQQARLQSVVDSLPPEEVSKIQLGLAKIQAEREKNRLDYDLGMHAQQQETIRSSKDIKGIRPEIANRHSWFALAYVGVFEGLGAYGIGSGANLEIALFIAAPTLAWFGFRTWDKFSKQGAS